MPDRPTGTVTFLFTDIEGSTTRWEHQRPAMQAALARHDAILRETINAHGGHVFKTVGDAFYAAFAMAPDAVESALAAQQALQAEAWDEALGVLRVRMALHTGGAEERDGDYFGPPLNRVARLLSAGHGGQILLSLATHELVRDQLAGGTELRDLGEHRLKDLIRPERIFQLVAPGLPTTFPPLKTLENQPNNLPLQLTPFIGRERELAAIHDRLLEPGVRLLTLTGVGGTGKTRLALQVAAELLNEFPDGVWFVDLAPAVNPADVVSTIAAALGVREAGESSLIDSVKAYLREKKLLLVLDNFEQIVSAAPLVSELLAAAGSIKALVTSRVALHLRGEHELAIPPLDLPGRTSDASAQRVSQYEAVQLFIERAQAVRADFAVTNANAPAVAEICVRLDGLPLAIELAAARCKLLTPEVILQRLSSPLRLLTGGARDLPARQQTLRATIDWSHGLLDEDEQRLFRRLAVFVGGWDLEANEAVCDPESELGSDVLDLLQSLVDKSLVRPAVHDDAPRFGMLETIREYALERLEASGEGETVRRRHARYYANVAAIGDEQIRGPDELPWLRKLEADHDNFRAALRWTVDRDDVDIALGLVAHLALFWDTRGHISEARAWMERALAMSAGVHPALRARVLSEATRFARNEADRAARTEESLKLWQTLGDKRGLAYALYGSGFGGAWLGLDRAEVRRRVEESIRLFREVGDAWGLSQALTDLGNVAKIQGSYDEAGRLYQEGLREARNLGNPTRLAYALHQVGAWIADHEHDLQRAIVPLEESLAINRELGEKPGVSYDLDMLGEIALLQRDYDRAAAYFEESERLEREMFGGLALGQLSLARLARVRGDYAHATTLAAQFLRESWREQWLWGIAAGLDVLAGGAVAVGDAGRAARLLGASDAIRRPAALPITLTHRAECERDIRAARALAGDPAFEAAWAEGQAMTLEQAVAYALDDTLGG